MSPNCSKVVPISSKWSKLGNIDRYWFKWVKIDLGSGYGGGAEDQWEVWNWSCDLSANERLKKNCTRWRTLTDGHGDYMTESSQVGQFSKNPIVYKISLFASTFFTGLVFYQHHCHSLHWLIKWITHPLWKYLQNTFTPKLLELGTLNFEKMFTISEC